MKEKYLNELEELLKFYDIIKEEMDDILADYGEMIDDAKEKNISDENIIELIGSPKDVVKDLSEGFNEREEDVEYIEIHHSGKRHKDNRIVALMPFLATITFFILGFGFSLWHPGWMVFLAIPVTAIVINVFKKGENHGLIALSPFIALAVFLFLGFSSELWHPGWLVFLIIPVLAILSNAKTMKVLPLITALSPFIALSFFILWGTYQGDWHLAWLAFLIIPILGGLQYDKLWKVLLLESSILVAVAAYLYLGITEGIWLYSLAAFLIPAGASLICSDDKFLMINKENTPIWIISLVTIVIYFGAGLIFKTTWPYLWMIFFAVPLFAILKYSDKDSKLVACMPFIATIIFFTLGYFFSFWTFSWLAFLLIPMVAIIKHA